MRADDPKLDKKRFYEIVHLPQGNAWLAPLASGDSIIGTIVSPTEKGQVRSIRGNGLRRIDFGAPVYIGIAAILRPLTQKEQTKIQRVLDMLPETTNANSNVSG